MVVKGWFVFVDRYLIITSGIMALKRPSRHPPWLTKLSMMSRQAQHAHFHPTTQWGEAMITLPISVFSVHIHVFTQMAGTIYMCDALEAHGRWWEWPLKSSIAEHTRVAIGVGVYFYEKTKSFKLNWQKGKLRGSLASKATGRNDAKACKSSHVRFHAKATELAWGAGQVRGHTKQWRVWSTLENKNHSHAPLLISPTKMCVYVCVRVCFSFYA